MYKGLFSLQCIIFVEKASILSYICWIYYFLQELIKEYKIYVNQDIVPDEVKDYYTKLANLTWKAVAKAIPMVLSVEEEYYDETIHELKDELEDNIDLSVQYRVEYVYPTLFTSNTHPREVALKGKVKIVF